METFAEESKKQNGQPGARQASSGPGGTHPDFQFTDNRPEALVQRKLRGMISNRDVTSQRNSSGSGIVQRTTWKWNGGAWQDAQIDGEEESPAPGRDGYFENEFVDTYVEPGGDEEVAEEVVAVRPDPRLKGEYPYGAANEIPHIHAYANGFYLKIQHRKGIKRYNIVQGGARHAQADMALEAAAGNNDLLQLIQNILETQV